MIKRKSASLGFIFTTILVDVIGIGIIIPVIPKLLEGLIDGGISDAAQIGGWLILAFGAMQFLFAPLIGELSDRFGRRPVLLLALLGLGIDYIFHAYAPSLVWLFVGRVLAGIAGGSVTVANAYIADISTPEERSKNFGLVGVAFGVGFIIGPVIGGLAGSAWGVKAPFLIAAGLTLLNFLFGLIFVPESLPEEKRRKFSWKNANPIGAVMHLNKYPGVARLVLALFLIYIAGQSLQSTWTFYTIHRYGWGEDEVGYSLGAVGILVAIVQGGLIAIAIKKLGEKKAILIGVVLWAIGLMLFGFASEGWMLYVFLIPYCLGGIAGPTLQGVMSNQFPDNEQGELQGGLTSMISLTGIIGPLIMTNLFYTFTKADAPAQIPGIPFFVSAVLVFISIALIWKPLKQMKVHGKTKEEPESAPKPLE